MLIYHMKKCMFCGKEFKSRKKALAFIFAVKNVQESIQSEQPKPIGSVGYKGYMCDSY